LVLYEGYYYYWVLMHQNNYLNKIGVLNGLNFLFHLRTFIFVTKLDNAAEVVLYCIYMHRLVTEDENKTWLMFLSPYSCHQDSI